MSVTAANSTPATNSLGVTPEAPWLGLRSFTEEVRDYFYGRDKEIQELFERVQHRTLTVLYGQSGWGKTSLLRAGLIPRLRDAGQTPLLIRLDFLDNPSADFNEASLPANVDLGSWARMMGECGIVDFIRECLEAQVVRKVRTTLRIERIGYDQAQQPSLWELFHDPGWGLTDTDLTPVLMFDQFEELFTQGEARRPDDAKAFFEALACLVENRPPASVRERMERDDDFADRLQTGPTAVKVLLTLRDDFLHRLERGRRRMPSMMDNRFELRPLRGPEAIRAVYDPGAIRGITSPIIPLETAAAIVRLVAGVPAQTPLDEIDNVPPLLSLMCEQLNVRRLARSESQIQIEGLANAPEVLREFYEASFATHPEALREFIEDDLVSESGFRESRTVQAAVEHLAARGVPDGAARLRQLVDSRLLVIEERGGVERMELTHDILAPIIVAARRERSDRLAREVARQQLAEERKKRRRFAAVTATMTLLLIAAIASGGLAWLAAQTARIEQARSRAAENQRRVAEQARVDEVITRQRYQALLHRVSVIDVAAGNRIMEEVYAAERTGPSPRGFSGVPKSREAGALWARALEHEPENQLAADRLWSLLRTRSSTRSMALRQRGDVFHASVSLDGRRIVTASEDKTARIWDAETVQPDGEPPRHNGAVRHASFSPDGRYVVTACWDNTARIWDAETGLAHGEPLRHDDTVWLTSFSPDGRRVVTTSSDNTARIWDADTGQPHGEPLQHDHVVIHASFSPDGRRIVTASWDKTARIWDAETGQPCGEPLRHDGIVFHASFSPDSCRIITASGDKTARIWSVEIADSSVGSHLPSSSAIAWAHQALGLRYRDDGTLELIPGDERLATLQRLPESNDRWRDLSEWMNADPLTRPIVVGASLSTAQIAIRERDFALRPFRERKGWSHYDHDWSSQLALESALQYDTTVPLARLLLANVLERLERAEEEAKRDAGIFLHAAHLREYDLDRLPDDPSLRKRAAAILRELPDSQVGVGPKPTLAKDEADKLDPPVTP